MTATATGNEVRELVEKGGGLLNQLQVAHVIGRNKSTTNYLVGTADFPKPVSSVGAKGRVWLREEVELWAEQHPQQYERPDYRVSA